MSSTQHPKQPAVGRIKKKHCGVLIDGSEGRTVMGGGKLGFDTTPGILAQLVYGWPPARSPHITLVLSFERQQQHPAVGFFSGNGTREPPAHVGIRFRSGTFSSSGADFTDSPIARLRTLRKNTKIFLITIKTTEPPVIEGIGLPIVSPSPPTEPSRATRFWLNETWCCGVDLLSLCQQTEFKLVMASDEMVALANDQFRCEIPAPDEIPRSPFPYTNG